MEHEKIFDYYYDSFKNNIQDKSFSAWDRLTLLGEFLVDYPNIYQKLGYESFPIPDDLKNKKIFKFNLASCLSVDYYMTVFDEIVPRAKNNKPFNDRQVYDIGSCYRALNSVAYVEFALREINAKCQYVRKDAAKQLYDIFFEHIDIFGPFIQDVNYLNLQRFYKNL